MIGFVVAMQKEARHFLDEAEVLTERTVALKRVYTGKFMAQDFVLIVGGIGKVNASMATQLIIDNFKVDKIINFGTAGGKDPENQHVGDVVIIDKACQFDFDLSEIDNVNVGYLQDYDLTHFTTSHKKYSGDKLSVATLGTADRFSTRPEIINIAKNLGATVIDMEGASVLQVAYSNGVDCYLVKVLTDVEGGAEESIFGQYLENVKEVTKLIPEAVKELILNI